jgi:hypothetical protein
MDAEEQAGFVGLYGECRQVAQAQVRLEQFCAV